MYRDLSIDSGYRKLRTIEWRFDWLTDRRRPWLDTGSVSLARTGLLAPHDGPAERLKVLDDVALAAVSAAPRRPCALLALTPGPHPTVEDHVDVLFLERMLEIPVL